MKVTEEVTYVITMNKKEALFLKSLVQNPIFENGLDIEEDEDRVIRRKFWDALPSLRE